MKTATFEEYTIKRGGKYLESFNWQIGEGRYKYNWTLNLKKAQRMPLNICRVHAKHAKAKVIPVTVTLVDDTKKRKYIKKSVEDGE